MTLEDLTNLLALEGEPSPDELEKAYAARLERFKGDAASAGSKPERLLAKREVKRLQEAADAVRERVGEMRARDLLRRARTRLGEGHPAAARALLQGAAALLPEDPLAPLVLDFREIEAECEAAAKERGIPPEPPPPPKPEPKPAPEPEPRPESEPTLAPEPKPEPENAASPPPETPPAPERPAEVRPSGPPIDRLTWASPAAAGFRLHLISQDCVVFGRDDRTDILLRSINPATGGIDWHKTRHISRRHFFVERRAPGVYLGDGHTTPEGSRVFSGNGIVHAGNRISEAPLPAGAPTQLSVTHLPAGPGVPHYRLHVLEAGHPPAPPAGQLSAVGCAGLFMERLDAVREHVLILWGTVALASLPLPGVRANSYLARVEGGFLYGEGSRWYCATGDASPFRTLEAGKLAFGHLI